MDEEGDYFPYDVTCHTGDCFNQDVTLRIIAGPAPTVVCGPCGQQITDIKEA